MRGRHDIPTAGFVNGQPPAANWSPGVFTGTAGSIFVPDNSVFENNDPTQPVTGGGHNWAFDQGTTTCKETDIGPAGGTPTAWVIPASNPTNCLLLPVISGSVGNPPLPIIKAITDVPFQGEAITPTCDPTLLSQPGAPNSNNTYFNQLGCSISQGAATTPQTATTFLFVAGIKGGLFSVQLPNIPNPAIGGPAGKVIASFNFYSAIPLGQKLTSAAVSPDGMFAIATSSKHLQSVFACLNPLGDPGDPSLPINPNFFIPEGNLVKCMSVGANNLQADLTTAFSPDNQPYFGGQRTVTSFNFVPGGSAVTAWPQCIFNGFGFPGGVAPPTLMGKLQAVFNANSANHCVNALPNAGFVAAGISNPQALISHGSFMYVPSSTAEAGGSGSVVQVKVTVDPASGLSRYELRTYLSGIAPVVTGLGVADDLGSLMVFTDPSGAGLAGQEVITKLPLCEDF